MEVAPPGAASSLFYQYAFLMATQADALSEVERLLKERFNPETSATRVLPSDAKARESARLDQLILAREDRGRMPLTKDKYLVKENEDLIRWERVTREFLRNLSPKHRHRVSPSMVYEWATGISTVELKAAGGSTADLRKIKQVLQFYFGKPFMTWIAGKKVLNCFEVPVGYYIKYHRPMTLTLWAEKREGTLEI